MDMADACDTTPLLWTDGGKVHFFWGLPRAVGGFPFQWTTSSDSGATWCEVQFPRFTSSIGPHRRQPITSALRDSQGAIYVASDGIGASSVLWVSKDGMKTWQNPGGRHTTCALLANGKTILGMGGKNSHIDGYMPQSVSADGGKTWQVSKTPFPALGSGQRPCLLRLASGRLFFCGDFQRAPVAIHFKNDRPQPPGVNEHGAFVALSEDEGRTWRIKKLIGTQPHEAPSWYGASDTLGYPIVRQSSDGVIHMITTTNRPCLHLALNEAWILSDAPTPDDDARLMANTANSIRDVKRNEENFADGRPRIVWHAGVGNDGRYLLHGQETWYYQNGEKQYEADYEHRTQDRPRDSLSCGRLYRVAVGAQREQRYERLDAILAERAEKGPIVLEGQSGRWSCLPLGCTRQRDQPHEILWRRPGENAIKYPRHLQLRLYIAISAPPGPARNNYSTNAPERDLSLSNAERGRCQEAAMQLILDSAQSVDSTNSFDENATCTVQLIFTSAWF